MGWNQGYTIFEQTVIAAYDQGKLDKELLSTLMEPYRGTDIDSGGRHGLLSKDGKEVEQIVIETFGGKVPAEPVEPSNDDNWEEWEDYHDAYYEAFSAISGSIGKPGIFGWE